MTERELLVELFDKAVLNSDDNYGMPNTEQCVDYLLSNGVTIPVRCEECKYNKGTLRVLGRNVVECDFYDDVRKPNGYCDNGERKDNG